MTTQLSDSQIKIPSLITYRHHVYQELFGDWVKYRAIMLSGDDFIEDYLEKFSDRESDSDFTVRKNLTYNPAFAKAAVQEVNNAIYQRLVDIQRIGGPQSYKEACLGIKGGVDRNFSTMTYFIGTKVLPELLPMRKIGVFVDRKPLPDGPRQPSQRPAPYLYTYCAEDILSWTYNDEGNFTAVLLKDHVDRLDPTTGLVIGITYEYRLLKKRDDGGGIDVILYDSGGQEINSTTLQLKEIPFHVAEISSSLLTDIANHQIALLNIASSDLAFILFANFPFYTEQYSPLDAFAIPPGPTTEDGSTAPSDSSKNRIEVGATKGRRYPKDLDRPDFINPSSEPLKVSMEKQQEIKEEIRTLINLTIANLKPVRASADSKIQDDRTLEAGLSYIGLELEQLERKIAATWAEYEGTSEVAEIHYPQTYSLKSDEQRFKEADQLAGFMEKVPSQTYWKAVAREIARVTVGHKVSIQDAEQINKEIDEAPVINIQPDTIRQDHEAGLVSTETASQLRGYPKGEVEKAKQDHAERLARIAISQAKGEGAAKANGRPPKTPSTNLNNPADRGVKDQEG